MKVHSIVMPITLSTLVLTAAAARSMQTESTDLICAHAKLTNLITNGTFEQFKHALEQELAVVKSTSATAHSQLRKSLSEHAMTLRTHKLTQLAQAISKSRIWAGVKAAIFGWIACAKLYQSDLWNNKNYLTDKKAWELNCRAILGGFSFSGTPGILSLFDLVTLLVSSTWAYENAHFAYYGTKCLVADIKRLDAIIVHLEQTA